MSFLTKSVRIGILVTMSVFLSSLLLLSSMHSYNPVSNIDAQQAPLEKSINISNNTGNSYLPKIVTSENRDQIYTDSIYILWTDNTTGNGDIYFKRSADNGTSFGNIENLSNSTGNSTDAQIAINQNNVYVVWTDNTTGNGDIHFKRSADNGTSFGSTQNLGTYPGKASAALIAAYQNNVYVMWSDDSTGNGDIYFKASLDNGTKFGGRKVLAKNNGSSFEPQMAVSPNNIIYAAWLDDTPYDRQQENNTSINVLYRVSNDSGSVFANRNTIGKDVGGSSDFIQISTMPGGSYPGMRNDAYVIWSDILKYREPGTFEVFLQTITNNGTAQSDPVNLSNNDGDSTMPSIAVSSSGNVYVTWSDDSTGNNEVYYLRVF